MGSEVFNSEAGRSSKGREVVQEVSEVGEGLPLSQRSPHPDVSGQCQRNALCKNNGSHVNNQLKMTTGGW